MRALLLALVLLAGCKKTTDRPVPTGPFAADLILNVNLGSHFARARLVTPDKTCVEISDQAKATLGGQPLKVTSKGGSKTGEYGHGSKPETITSCVDPMFELADTKPLEGLVSTTLEIMDGGRLVRATFNNLFAPRTFRLDREQGSTLKVGDKVKVIWAPPTDKVSAIVLDRGKPSTPPELRVKVEPTPGALGTYDLTVPPAWAGEGEAKVMMNMTIVPGVESCAGVSSCNGDVITPIEAYRVKVDP